MNNLLDYSFRLTIWNVNKIQEEFSVEDKLCFRLTIWNINLFVLKSSPTERYSFRLTIWT
ncbi:hypothetical protein J0W65_17835 [Clostridioides difficile]|nr:hypothetical protein [Clostridioides difficile]